MGIMSYKVTKRTILFTLLASIGGVLFVPFVLSNPQASEINPAPVWLGFIFGSAVIVFITSWFGFKFSDKADLPMPMLRNWESGEEIKTELITTNVIKSLLFGAVFAIVVIIVSEIINLPDNPGTLFIRLLTTPFAAVVTETIFHLFLMSLLVMLIKKNWIPIIISSILFAVAHGTPSNAHTEIILFVLLFNFSFATLSGYVYSRYGFEYAVITHAVAHFIVLGYN